MILYREKISIVLQAQKDYWKIYPSINKLFKFEKIISFLIAQTYCNHVTCLHIKNDFYVTQVPPVACTCDLYALLKTKRKRER